ncbi:MAG TPA: hypothetical protein VF657_22680 [Actinoplanes sp.]|jgi:hypothetical protein
MPPRTRAAYVGDYSRIPVSQDQVTGLPTSLGSKVDRDSIVVNVADHGVDATGATDCTTALRTILQSGAKRILMRGTFLVNIPNGGSLASFTGVTGLHIDASSATINNPVDYGSQAFTSVFLLNGCTNTRIEIGQFTGFHLADLYTNLGRQGVIVVRAINGCAGVTVKANITNARYGVQSGEYADPTKGGCTDFDLDIRGSYMGYPIALYRAEGLRGRVRVDNFDRAVYIAGVSNVDLDVQFKNPISGGDTVCLITDAMTGVGTSKGCSNVDIRATDMGSTTMPVSCMVAGIMLSRVDPGTEFENVRVHVSVRSSDTVAYQIGAFRVHSGANQVQPSYPFNWEQTIVLRNITVSGIIDRSGQSMASESVGPLYVNTWDTGTHYATVTGLSIEDLTIIPAATGGVNARITCPGLQDKISFRNFTAPRVPIVINTGLDATVEFIGSAMGPMSTDGSAVVSLIGSTVASVDTNIAANLRHVNSTVAGGGALIRTKQIELTLTGTSVTWAAAIPAGAIVLGVTGRITQAITGATGYKAGVSGDDDRFVGRPDTTLGATFDPANMAVEETFLRYYLVSTAILVGGLAGTTFTGGKIRLTLHYILLSAATS